MKTSLIDILSEKEPAPPDNRTTQEVVNGIIDGLAEILEVSE